MVISDAIEILHDIFEAHGDLEIVYLRESKGKSIVEHDKDFEVIRAVCKHGDRELFCALTQSSKHGLVN